MTKKERVKEIVLQLKQIKDERDLTVSDIYDMLIAAGEDLSLATTKRVFAPGSEEQGFRYRDTLQPIVRVLVGVQDEGEPLGVAEADALKNVALLKDTMIQDLQKELDTTKDKLAHAERELALLRDRVDFLKEQIDRKDDYIDRLAKKAGI